MHRRRTIVVREHGRLRIDEDGERSIRPSEADALERLNDKLGTEVVAVGRRTVTATRFVGTIRAANLTLDVLPKIDDVDEGSARRRLVELLAVAGAVPHRRVGLAEQAAGASSLLEVILSAYVDGLAHEFRRSPPRSLDAIARNRRALKGKLLFTENLRRNAFDRSRFMTRAGEVSDDLPLTQVLRAATQLAARHAPGSRLQRRAAVLLSELSGVCDVVFHRAALDRITVPRAHARYEPLFQQARWLLRGEQQTNLGATPTLALVFDMERVFEQAIGALAKRCAADLDLNLKLQDSAHHLVVDGFRPLFPIQPDLVVYARDRPLAVVDMKWKRLDPAKRQLGIARTDVHQMLAYAVRYGVDTVVLVYPAGATVDGASWRIEAERPVQLLVRTVDVRRPVTGSTSLEAQVRALVSEASTADRVRSRSY